MECGWELEQPDLGGLGFSGICRVFLGIFLHNFATFGPPLIFAFLFTNSIICSALSSRDVRGFDEGTSLLPLVGEWGVFFYLEIICFLVSLPILLLCTPTYVFCVASLYCTGGDLRAAGSVLNERLPLDPLMRLVFTFHLVAVSFLVASLSVAALLLLEDEIMLLLRLLVWTSAVFAAVVCQLACVFSVLEVAVLFGAVRRSRELLARKFWAVANLLLALGGCIIALLVAFPALLVDVALGLGLGFQLAAGAAMALNLKLCAFILLMLVAEPVVFMVCKNHRQGVTDLVHLHSSTRLAVDRDN